MLSNLFKKIKENFNQTPTINFVNQSFGNFGPNEGNNRTINVGETITWTWIGNHSIANGSDGFPEVSQTANSATATFTQAGSFFYSCGVHGTDMSGMITVIEPTIAPTTTARQTTRAPTTTARQTTRAPTTTPSPSVSGTSGTPIVTTAAPISSTSAGPSTPAPQTPPSLPKNINGGMIAGIVVSCIVVSIIGYYAYKRRRSSISS